MELINQMAEDYCMKYSTPLDEILLENQANTMANHPHAQMLSGHLQGKLLEMLSCMINPEKILEIGTFTGFSALCLSKGLGETGILHTIEIREEDAETARQYFNRSESGAKIKLHIGNALEIIPELNENWDLIFLDADKVSYIEYYELTLPYLNRGGWIIADNVLFHGEVLKTELKGKNAKAIQAFNEHVSADPRVEMVMLTVRDGLMLIRKK